MTAETIRPAPLLTEDNHAFWEAAAAGRLVAQRCSDCGRFRHPPRPMCPQCHSLAVDIVDLSGEGTIYSFSILHYPTTPYFDYPVLGLLVDLDEGIRLVSNLVDVDPASITDLSLVGRRVTVTFVPTADAMAVPVFRLADGGAR
ncbi:MAG: Zn-ribbon domain-containing OB-fold protein [Acidimicrobiia bacterium]